MTREDVIREAAAKRFSLDRWTVVRTASGWAVHVLRLTLNGFSKTPDVYDASIVEGVVILKKRGQ